MKRKVIGIVAALVLAIAGTLALVSYVQSAKDNAVAGERLVEVYVVDSTIREGTPASEIEGSVRRVSVPAKVVADGAITNLRSIDDDLVAAVDLLPGEQLVASRLVDARSLTRVEVPTGLQEITVALDPERAVGGELRAGDLVGVVLSFEPFDLDTSSTPDAEPAGTGATITAIPETPKTPNMTHLTFQQVLVTGVQFDQSDPDDVGSRANDEANDDETDDKIERAPGNQLLVTLAVTSPQVEQIVFAAEFGHVWLTGQDSDTDPSGSRIVTLRDVYGLEMPW